MNYTFISHASASPAAILQNDLIDVAALVTISTKGPQPFAANGSKIHLGAGRPIQLSLQVSKCFKTYIVFILF